MKNTSKELAIALAVVTFFGVLVVLAPTYANAAEIKKCLKVSKSLETCQTTTGTFITREIAPGSTYFDLKGVAATSSPQIATIVAAARPSDQTIDAEIAKIKMIAALRAQIALLTLQIIDLQTKAIQFQSVK